MKLTIKEAAKKLKISENRVWALIDSKQLPATKNGKSWEINPQDLQLVKDRPPGRREKTAKLFLRRYPKASPQWGESFIEARSGKSGTGKSLIRIDLKEGRGSNRKGLEKVNAQKKIFVELRELGYQIAYDINGGKVVL